MKKPVPAPALPEAEENPRNRKLYLRRLEEEGVPLQPVLPKLRAVGQFQLAHLAATLAQGAGEKRASGELATRALELWSASGRVLFIESQAAVMVKGLFCLDPQDWAMHARALIASLNDLQGSVPGLNDAEAIRNSYLAAQARAAAVVNTLWINGPEASEVLRRLFPGAGETDDSRGAKFAKLLALARETVEAGDRLPVGGKTGDPWRAELLRTWDPLASWDDKELGAVVMVARELVDRRDEPGVAERVRFGACLTRWLAVLRQEQLAAARRRA